MKVTCFSNRVYYSSLDNLILETILDDLDKFNSMVRKSHALLVCEKNKGKEHDKSNHLTIKELFGVSDYYTNSAVQEAKANYNNAVENHKIHIESQESKILKIQDKIKKTEKALTNKFIILDSLISISKVIKHNKVSLKKKKLPKFKTYRGAKEYLKDIDSLNFAVRKRKSEVVYNIYTFEVCYLKPEIKRLKHKLKMLKFRLEKETNKLNKLKESNPTTCFGSRKLFKKQFTVYKQNLSLWKEKLDYAKNKTMTISGRRDAAQGNFVFRYKDNVLKFNAMNGTEIILENITFPYGQKIVDKALNTKINRRATAWSIENHKEYFIIKCIVELETAKDINYSRASGVIGLDVNQDRVALCETNGIGNFINSWTIKYNLEGLTSKQAAAVIEDVAVKIIKICIEKGKPLAMEDLVIKASKRSLLYNSSKLNYKLSSFAFAKIDSAIESRAFKDNVAIFKTNPAYSSQIGKIKYQKKLGESIHTSASYVIARRCQGFKDKVPKKLKKFIPENKLKNHNWSHWRALSSQLKEIDSKYFYRNIDISRLEKLKDYKLALTT